MITRASLLWLLLSLLVYEHVYAYSFPKDHFAHPGYQTEWWYYTGNLTTKDKRHFGYELVFFKVEWPEYQTPSDWKAQTIYLAHFAITDTARGDFFYAERINRSFGGMAGASTQDYHLWNESFQVRLENNTHILHAKDSQQSISLVLTPLKAPTLHNKGISMKGHEADNYSHYYSITRLQTTGTLVVKGESFRCTGLSWMDHEWMNNRRPGFSLRWDWLSIQLQNGIDLMFYIIRDKHNTRLSVSSGTFIHKNGNTEHLHLHDIKLKALQHWRSPSGAKYPIAWSLSIPTQRLHLNITARIPNQEFISHVTGIKYWEGACTVQGTLHNRPITGVSYIEMTGYN